MKRILLSILLIAMLFPACAQITPVWSSKSYTVPAGGASTTVPAMSLPGLIYVNGSATTTLSGNYTLALDSTPPVGTLWQVHVITTGITFGAFTITLFNYIIEDQTDLWLNFRVETATGGGKQITYSSQYSFMSQDAGWINTGSIQYTQLEDLTSAQIIVGNASNIPTATAVTGDISLSNAGVTAIAAGAIVNADVNASAAIARTKLATGSASQVVINDGSGVLTSEATLATSRGGWGTSIASATGIPSFSSGTPTIGAFTDMRDLHIGFFSSDTGTYYLTWPVAVTVTAIEVRVETLIDATDSATLLIQNDAATAMAGSNLSAGLLTLAAGATTGTGYTSTLTSNNTFTAGQRMRLTSAKATPGGRVNVQVTFTRLN